MEISAEEGEQYTLSGYDVIRSVYWSEKRGKITLFVLNFARPISRFWWQKKEKWH